MPRTTLNIDASILRRLRAKAEREHRSMGEVATELLVAGLEAESGAASRGFVWKTFDMGEARVDLSDWPAVKDFLYAEEDARLGLRD